MSLSSAAAARPEPDNAKRARSTERTPSEVFMEALDEVAGENGNDAEDRVKFMIDVCDEHPTNPDADMLKPLLVATRDALAKITYHVAFGEKFNETCSEDCDGGAICTLTFVAELAEKMVKRCAKRDAESRSGLRFVEAKDLYQAVKEAAETALNVVEEIEL